MQHLADLLASIPLPAAPEDAPPGDPRALLAGCSLCDTDLMHDLGADLPGGHLHVWGGPHGAGKTAFLLCLLKGAADQGRRVVYATYDLPPDALALRLLAMTAGVQWRALPDPGADAATCALEGEELERARAAREVLSELPFHVLPARGFSAQSLWDRVVRLPHRADVLAVDYLQGVVRAPGSEMGVALRELSDLAERLHVAVVCAVRPGDALEGELATAAGGASSAEGDAAADRLERLGAGGVASSDRVGWISTGREAGDRRAQVLHNRHGRTPAVPLHFDEATGSLGRAGGPGG